MKFKVIESDWCVRFRGYIIGDWEPTEWETYEGQLTLQQEEGRDYDGPLAYIEKCEPMPFPERENVKYCVRLDSREFPPSSTFYKAYQCYCYQLGNWWKYKKVEHMFTDIHIPVMSRREYEKVSKIPWKFLSKRAYIDAYFWMHSIELDRIGRSSRHYSIRSIINSSRY